MKVRMGLAPLQFSDTNKQHTDDIEDLFGLAIDRKWAWAFGTETGPGSGNTGEEIMRIAREAGYKPWVPSRSNKGIKRFTDGWIAVREDLITGGWKQGYNHGFDGSDQYEDEMKLGRKKWAPKGLAHVSFDCEKLGGRVNLGVSHYLTDARDPDSKFWELNKKLTKVIDDWANEVSKGPDLVFYGGDQNMADHRNNEPQGDTFMGGKLKSIGDELKEWHNAGHGTIDVIASHPRDGRVKAIDTRVFRDKDFFQHGDHAVSEATYRVESVR